MPLVGREVKAAVETELLKPHVASLFPFSVVNRLRKTA